MWGLLDIKKMNEKERPNFCQRCGQKLIFVNAIAPDYSIIKDAYRKCPDCGWEEKNKEEKTYGKNKKRRQQNCA